MGHGSTVCPATPDSILPFVLLTMGDAAPCGRPSALEQVPVEIRAADAAGTELRLLEPAESSAPATQEAPPSPSLVRPGSLQRPT